ncbi:MAG: hypothetical protein LQ346_003827 [Caloplaca aetnensis]|nr:MAG: hypothetical protein LQ346_003827 [Caloplaca aetnensis]
MQKWPAHCALGRGRPSTLHLYKSLNRHFTASSSQSAQETQQPGPHSQQQPDNSGPRERQGPGFYFKSIKFNAPNDRDLAAVPNPTPPPPGRSISEGIPAGRAPLDARNLGENRRPADGVRIIRFGARSSNDDQQQQAPKFPSRRDPSDRQYAGSSTTASHTRNSRSGPPRQGPRQPRSFGGGGGGGREKNKRSGPSSFERGGEGREGGRDRSKPALQEPTEEEAAYFATQDRITDPLTLSLFGINAQKHTQEFKPQPYTPAEVSLRTLQGMGPGLACSELGMAEAVTQRMLAIAAQKDEYDARVEELARRYGEAKFCHFRSKREREHVMKTVERGLAGTGDNAALDAQEEEEKAAEVDARMREEGEKLAGRLLKGGYRDGGPPLGEGPVAELLERYTRTNESYRPEQGRALAGKIATLVPLKAGTAAPARA